MSANQFLAQFAALPPSDVRAVIINCSTRAVSTLALLSALRHAQMPVCLIDCESTDGSWQWFRQLQTQHTFDLLQAPLRPHGVTLDALFRVAPDAALLLVDSDLEIRSADLVPAMRDALVAADVYGTGFLHPSERFLPSDGMSQYSGRYMERMWIPLCLMKVAPLREAIQQGSTFMHSRDYLEIPWSRLLSKLFFARHRLPLIGEIGHGWFAKTRLAQFGEVIPYFEYDTGARIHAALVAAGRRFVGLGEPWLSTSLRHYHGVTRATLTAGQANATAPNAIAIEVAERLRGEYGMEI